jgi:opacity protein-like surface antigen
MVLLSSVAAWGQSFDFGLGFGRASAGGRTIGTVPVQTEQGIENANLTLGSGFAFNTNFMISGFGFTGHEFGYNFTRANQNLRTADGQTFVDDGSNINIFYYNFVLKPIPGRPKFEPYVGGGPAIASFSAPGQSIFSGGSANRFGLNYGAGLKVYINDFVHTRFDVRQTWTGSPEIYLNQNTSGSFRQTVFSVGIGLSI